MIVAHLFLAMAHQKLGHVVLARQELDATRAWFDSHDPDFARGRLLDYGWTEWLQSNVLRNEAEALILYDPIFPADPFAPAV